ncbi:hypothetical protein KEM54_000505 [Ascosphaera aggregata]|nr:hypothetical protein KEM54_000505 [Ascosphaera aggregata]
MGSWYSRAEAQKRFSFFFCSTTLAGAFGGFIASGIGRLQGARGYNGWRWVFIIEGACTAILGLLWYFVVPGFPETSTWLKDDERRFIEDKLRRDTGKAGIDSHIAWRDVLDVMKDCEYTPLSPAEELSSITEIISASQYLARVFRILRLGCSCIRYGFDNVATQLHSIPPWAAAFGLAMILAYISDRIQHRYTFAMFSLCVCIAGFAILLTVHGPEHRRVEYAALFLVTMGSYSAMPAIVCWFVTNLAGHKRKSIGSAIHIGFGNIGGIIATYSFSSKDAPYYSNGRDRLVIADGSESGVSLDLYDNMGDLSPTFRYKY